jgi:protein involved in polysaccharide export with SLBB domain
MHTQAVEQALGATPAGASRAVRLACAAVLACLTASGCAALSNPVAMDAVPMRRLPPDVSLPRKDYEATIPLTLLRQKEPDAYRLGPRDVVGLWIEGILGERTQPPPYHIPETGSGPPALGFPIPVREDGTLPLPLINPVKVEGLTLAEAQEEIIRAYLAAKILKEGMERRVVLTLIRQRTYRVLVVRQDAGAASIEPTGTLSTSKRGSGFPLDLPAYQNDVLNALVRSGGLPGLEAINEVIIERGYFASAQRVPGLPAEAPACPDAAPPPALVGQDVEIVRIPLRMKPGEELPFRPEDVVLRNGDVVFIEARDPDVYYTAGLLPAKQWVLPRDYDLDILQAVSLAGGPLLSGGILAGQYNLSGSFITAGIGFPSPSQITVIRKTAGGGQLPIRVDLNRALREPQERLVIKPGDVIVLQETVLEALSRYFTNQFHISIVGKFINTKDVQGTGTVILP